jgi:adenine-specific DNA-methyltransferase
MQPMQPVRPGDPETRSLDVVADSLAALKQLLPAAFSDGRLDVDTLRQLLGDSVADDPEKYGLTWHGKRRARQVALTPSTGTLRPAPHRSVNWDATSNLLIEGDNLEVLKLLQKSYAGRVKLIYIDPPYNTGNDFVYPDDFRSTIRNYLRLTGQLAEDGAEISSERDPSGRFHTDWLNMMYPRLKLARNLLQEDGAIFVSIDDVEASNLRHMLDELFGTENFVAQFVWEKRTTRENRRVFSFNHDYLVCFARNKPEFEATRNLLPSTDALLARYANPDDDPRGPWQSVSLNAQAGHATKAQFYTVTTPGGRRIDPPPGRCWVVTKPVMDRLIAEDRVWFGREGNNVPRRKHFLAEAREGLTPHTLWTAGEVGTNDSAKKDLIELFGGVETFETPKPVGLIQRIVEVATNESDLILDFFAGSGTTAEAVLRAGARRRYILVQYPEALSAEARSGGRDAYATVADICRDRIVRAAERIDPVPADPGFRYFRLDASNVRHWDTATRDVEQQLFDLVDNMTPGRTARDLLFELLLNLGLDLSCAVEARSFGGVEVFGAGDGVLFACLPDSGSIDAEAVEAIAKGIIDWRQELDPAGDVTVYFKDAGFRDDVDKTNMAAILRQHGFPIVKSL